MSERWGVTLSRGDASRFRVSNGIRPMVFASREAAELHASTYPRWTLARVVRLVPRRNASAQRRVFDGGLTFAFGLQTKLVTDEGRYVDLGDMTAGIPNAKRIRVTVEVLPDGATDAKGGVSK